MGESKAPFVVGLVLFQVVIIFLLGLYGSSQLTTNKEIPEPSTGAPSSILTLVDYALEGIIFLLSGFGMVVWEAGIFNVIIFLPITIAGLVVAIEIARGV